MSDKLLAGIRILDFTTAGAGPRGTSQLGKLGAEVLKLEPREGNSTTRQQPMQGGISTHYSTMMFNKRSAFFDPRASTPEQRKELITWADVLLQNLKPGSLDAFGFSYEQCRAINPDIVYVSISAWGDRGPFSGLPGADPNGAGYAGWPSHTGEHGGDPEFIRMSYVDHLAGTSSATAAILGLMRREETGVGSYIHVSLLHAALWAETHHLATAVLNEVPRPSGSRSGLFAPDWAVRCGDGQQLAILARTQDEWLALCEALESPMLASDARFADNQLRVRNQEALDQIIAGIVSKRAAYWWTLQFTRHRVPHALAQIYPALKDNAQVVANEYVKVVPVPGRGNFTMPEHPWRFSRSPLPEDLPPMPGDNTTYLGELDMTPRPSPKPQSEVSPREAWLHGLVVGDATQGITGPLATSLYAAMGATVLKFEPPEGDYARQAAPAHPGTGIGIPFLSLNAGKQIVSAPPDPSELDVLFVDQDSSWLGFDVETLEAEYPRLVTCRITANGPLGPASAARGGELTSQIQAEYQTGLGRPDDRFIMRLGADVVSATTALASFQGTLAALWERRSSGTGQHVEVSMLSTAMFARMPVWSVLGEPDEWIGHLCDSWTLPPHYAYPTADGHLDFSPIRMTQEQYTQFLSDLGLLEQARSDPRFDIEHSGQATSYQGRYGREFREIWSKAFGRYSTAEIATMISQLGGSATPMNDLGQVVSAPQVVANDFITTVLSNGVPIPVVRPPFDGAGILWGAQDIQTQLSSVPKAKSGAAS